MGSSSSSGLAFLLHLVLLFDILFAFDKVLTVRYGVCICETYPEKTESQGKAPVVFAPYRQSPSCWVSTSADLSDFELTSFARLWSSSRHCESHAEPKCSLEVLALQTASQAKRDPLSDLPVAMADGNGSHLHPWCQAAADLSAELSATMELSRWTSVLPGRPVPSQSEVPSQVSKPSKEITKRRQRQGQCRIWTVLSVPVLSALATSGISHGPSIATTEWSTASVGLSWCTEQYDADDEHDADAECFSAAAMCSRAGLHPVGHACACMVQEAVPNELLNYLQKRSVDLPPDVQQRVQTESRKQGKRAIKDLQAAAKSLGEARTAYEEALVARTQHISSWKSFLAEAVKNWTDYAKLFEQHEQALQLRISAAKDQFQEAKECLDASKTSAGQVTEISDEEELPGDSENSAMQITESIQTLSNSLMKLSKEAESIRWKDHQRKDPEWKRKRRRDWLETVRSSLSARRTVYDLMV